MSQERFNQFIDSISKTQKVWLLQSRPGMFAMLEGVNDQSYIPMWANEEDAKNAAVDDWENYTVDYMEFPELEAWLRELAEDKIDIAVAPEKEGKILSLQSEQFRKWIKPQVKEVFQDKEEDIPEDDFGEGWAAAWPDEK